VARDIYKTSFQIKSLGEEKGEREKAGEVFLAVQKYMQDLNGAASISTVVNMPRYGCYSQARIAIQLDRYQKDLGSV
jgi:hypothetical protein